MAMERILESDEERAAPIVPEERAKAAMRTRMSDLRRTWRVSHRPDVLRPRLGPDIWWKFGFGRYRQGKRGGAHNKIYLTWPQIMKGNIGTSGWGLSRVQNERRKIKNVSMSVLTPSRRIHSAWTLRAHEDLKLDMEKQDKPIPRL